MITLNVPKFTVKIASKPKHNYISTNKISRKCYAVVKEINGVYKAVINIDKLPFYFKEGEKSNKQLIVPFTARSLHLKDKIYVFSKKKDKFGRHTCIIRTPAIANSHFGSSEQYQVFHDNLLIAGHVVRKNGIMLFEYEDLIAYHYKSECRISDIVVNDSKPLFNK